MAGLHNTNILVGVTGGIAAYKSAELIRRLRDAGASVQVVMTPAAEAFITPLTLQAVSGNPVRTSLLDPEAEAGMGHIELAKWADLVVVAPASADFLARAVHGLANDLLSTLCLATESPIALAPAMNQAMWHNPVTQANVAKIATYPQFRLWGPTAGSQACGDVGQGRMLEACEIVRLIQLELQKQQTPENNDEKPANQRLEGKRVVITAGPTREAIDPVRYLSNESSGKMGYALALAAKEQGATVELISGPCKLAAPEGVTTSHVVTAQEMATLSLKLAAEADVFIGAAAVADYRPAKVAEQKIKKGTGDELQLNLIKNPDIIASVAQLERRPFVVGFAAETHNLNSHASYKLERKRLDMIVANDVSDASIGFNSDNNAATLFSRNPAKAVPDKSIIPVAPKKQVAEQIIAAIAATLSNT